MDREDFMDIVYSELESDPDNNRANRIIWAADGYAERRVNDALQTIEELQPAQLGTNLAEVGTDKNVGTKISREPLELARAIDGLTEWQKHVQTDSNINRDISIAIEALKAQLGTNLSEVGTDCISRSVELQEGE